jgi:uncharacterized membrane protein YdjX (TVP38/TMEM64 family)
MESLYLFLLSIVFNSIPIISPPTSLLLSYFYIDTGINILILTSITIFGAMIGRTVLYFAVRYLGLKFLADNVHYGYEILRKIVHKNSLVTALCMMIYCITPLSTAAVFIVAGAARIKLWPLLLGFAIGRFINYVLIVKTISFAYKNLEQVIGDGIFSPASIALQIIGIIGAALLVFLDWEQVILYRRLRFHKKILK